MKKMELEIVSHSNIPYNEKISLGDIAALEGITTYHASHFIKKRSAFRFRNI